MSTDAATPTPICQTPTFSCLAFDVSSEADAAARGRTSNAKRQTPNVKRATICLVVLLAPAAANACTVCMGDSNSNIAGAANGAIFLMLGAIGSMLAGLAAFGFYLYKRANAPIPPHLALVEEMRLEDGHPSHA